MNDLSDIFVQSQTFDIERTTITSSTASAPVSSLKTIKKTLKPDDLALFLQPNVAKYPARKSISNITSYRMIHFSLIINPFTHDVILALNFRL